METPGDSVGSHSCAAIPSPASEYGATSFFLASFLDDMQRGDRIGAVNVGVYTTGCGAAGAWTRLGRLNCLAERRRLDCWTHEITRRQTTTKKKNNVGAAQVSRWFVPDCAPAMVMRLHASGHRRLTPSTCCFDAAECSPSSLSDEDPWSAMTRKQNDEADLVTATVKGNVA